MGVVYKKEMKFIKKSNVVCLWWNSDNVITKLTFKIKFINDKNFT